MTLSQRTLLLLAFIALISAIGFLWWRGSADVVPKPPPQDTLIPWTTPVPWPDRDESAASPESAPPPAEPSLDNPVHWEAVDSLPRLGYRVRPEYPEILRAEAIKAEVQLRLTVDTDGSVARAEVLDSPHPAFDEPALAAARQFRFEPATRDGQPVPFAVETTVVFDPLR